MRIFGESEATHYCSSYSGLGGDATQSVEFFIEKHFAGGGITIREGTPVFGEYRDCSLRDAERSLFFAVSHFRRALDLMISSSAPWSHVTLYYGSWFACHSLIGMFGSTVLSPKWVVDVIKGCPGQQELQVRRIGNKAGQEPTTYRGSHERFWDLFHTAIPSLITMVDSRFAATLSLVDSDPTWQIDRRNEVNYDTLIGIGLSENFHSTFCESSFPTCLGGVLNTQFQLAEALLELACSYACKFGLNTDALNGFGVPGSLHEKVRSLICEAKVPSLV
jgi:hypothetical protein